MAILDTATETRSILSDLHQKIFKLSAGQDYVSERMIEWHAEGYVVRVVLIHP